MLKLYKLSICFRVCLYVRGVDGELAGGGLKPGPAGKARKIFREIGVRIFLQNDAKSWLICMCIL